MESQNFDMNSTESRLKRLTKEEVVKESLRVQLPSVHELWCEKEPQRQTVFLQNSADVGSSIDVVTGWLTKTTKQASHSPLLNLLTQYERYNLVFDNIYQRLDIKDVIAISRTCKRLSSFYKNMLPCRWNIDRRLARFVNDPKEFRSGLGEADALISGTFALLFFAQLYWLDSGLDIYVRQGSKADALIRYVGEDKSYQFEQSYGWSDNDRHRTLTKVLIFRRIVPPASPQIRFHLTRTPPLHSILTDCAFSTAHVNIITWNKAYCMFPNTTFMDRRMYFLHDPDEAMGQILSNYSSHGWRTSDWVDFDQDKGCNKPGIREGIRRIGDSATWIVPLNLYKIRPPECPDSVLESCTFQISPDSRPHEARYGVTGLKTFGVGAQTFSCCMLRHAYTFHIPDNSWVTFLRERLSRVIALEALKTGDKGLIARARQRHLVPDGHEDCPLLKSVPRFRRPDGWEHVDHLVPIWFEEWRVARRDRTEGVHPTLPLVSMVSSQRSFSCSPIKHLAQPSRPADLQPSGPHIGVTSVHNASDTSLQTKTMPKQRGEYLSLRSIRPRAFIPPPLNLSSTKSEPLIPDLLTPPPDIPLPAIPTGRQSKRSPLYIPSYLSSASFKKASRNAKEGFESMSPDSTGSEEIFPEDMIWI